MKLPYMKPEFGQILLTENYPKGCEIESPFEWTACPISLGTSGPFNREVIVFSTEIGCTVSNQGESYICYFTGVSNSVFGS